MSAERYFPLSQVSCPSAIDQRQVRGSCMSGCLWLASWKSINKIVGPSGEVTMSDFETVLAELTLAARLYGEEVQGCKRDLRKAYWQVPLSQKGPRIFMILWYAPSSDVGEEFGAAGTWCCNRVFKALTLGSTSSCYRWTTTSILLDVSLFLCQCKQLTLFRMELLMFWAIIGRRKTMIFFCSFPCWVCPLKLSTSKRCARKRLSFSSLWCQKRSQPSFHCWQACFFSQVSRWAGWSPRSTPVIPSFE